MLLINCVTCIRGIILQTLKQDLPFRHHGVHVVSIRETIFFFFKSVHTLNELFSNSWRTWLPFHILEKSLGSRWFQSLWVDVFCTAE